MTDNRFRRLRWELASEPLTEGEVHVLNFIAKWKVRHGSLPDYSQIAFGLSMSRRDVAVICGGLVKKERITVRLTKTNVVVKTLRVRGPDFYRREPAMETA